jgi:nicotinamide-nucleotide amidase
MNVTELTRVVARLLVQKKLTVSVCESCTGGLLGSMITGVPGSSAFFKGGIIAYANDVKRTCVGVEPKALRKYGAVSLEVAQQMSRGVRKKLKTHIGISITGIAGPSGGDKLKPVGLVYISVATRTDVLVEQHILKGTRNHIRKRACKKALLLLLRVLN